MTQEQAVQKARELRDRTEEEVIVFYDEDLQELNYCRESHWDFLVDTGQVESNWIVAVVD